MIRARNTLVVVIGAAAVAAVAWLLWPTVSRSPTPPPQEAEGEPLSALAAASASSGGGPHRLRAAGQPPAAPPDRVRRVYDAVAAELPPGERDVLFAMLATAQLNLVAVRDDCMAGELVNDLLACSDIVIAAVDDESNWIAERLEAEHPALYAAVEGHIRTLVIGTLVSPFDSSEVEAAKRGR